MTIPAPHGLTASVVICAHTERRWTELTEAVASVRDQTHPALEIVVVVDHHPGLLARARDAMAEVGVLVMANAGRPGLSGARNTGVAAACGEIVAFLDDDARAEPRWLETLLAPYGRDGVVGVGGSIAPLWEGGAPRWFPAELLWTVGCTYRGLPEAMAPVRNLIGANMSFRRDVLRRVDGFTSSLGRAAGRVLHCEETELCIRVRRAQPDGVILYEPRAVVRHHVPRARRSWRYLRERCFTEGLAKAQVARLVGAELGLSSERDYVLRTLPTAVARGVADGLMRRDPTGPARSGVLLAGLMITATGYAAGRALRR